MGFNLWYAVAEEDRLGLNIPTSEYSARFMGLLIEHRDRLCDNADFCWAFGLGLSLFWFMFPGATEELGEDLLSRAKSLEAFWERFDSGRLPEEEIVKRFKGRGIFHSYYLRA